MALEWTNTKNVQVTITYPGNPCSWDNQSSETEGCFVLSIGDGSNGVAIEGTREQLIDFVNVIADGLTPMAIKKGV